ncbi:hypothetical protein [Delftia sp. 60]|uniref:hypothetical protein n=1 Tax=Delftia sp. 60 TaxID=2035216 RepID=UPI0011789C3B|nr:hypothetical protein [Delftia sp. 60]
MIDNTSGMIRQSIKMEPIVHLCKYPDQKEIADNFAEEHQSLIKNLISSEAKLAWTIRMLHEARREALAVSKEEPIIHNEEELKLKKANNSFKEANELNKELVALASNLNFHKPEQIKFFEKYSPEVKTSSTPHPNP